MRLSTAFAFSTVAVMASPAILLAQRAKPVAEVQVVPAAVTMAVGARHRLAAMAYDADGNVMVSGVRYHWSSNNVNVARVDSTGTVTAVGAGEAVVRAAAMGSGSPPKQGAAAVTVRGKP